MPEVRDPESEGDDKFLLPFLSVMALMAGLLLFAWKAPFLDKWLD